jgi:hypothetical protein
MGWQWPDYWSLMGEEIIKYAKRALQPTILERWSEIRQAIPKLHEIFVSRLVKRFKLPRYLLVIEELPNRAIEVAKREAIKLAAHDPRTLGQMENFVHGHAFYGIQTDLYRV